MLMAWNSLIGLQALHSVIWTIHFCLWSLQSCWRRKKAIRFFQNQPTSDSLWHNAPYDTRSNWAVFLFHTSRNNNRSIVSRKRARPTIDCNWKSPHFNPHTPKRINNYKIYLSNIITFFFKTFLTYKLSYKPCIGSDTKQ